MHWLIMRGLDTSPVIPSPQKNREGKRNEKGRGRKQMTEFEAERGSKKKRRAGVEWR